MLTGHCVKPKGDEGTLSSTATELCAQDTANTIGPRPTSVQGYAQATTYDQCHFAKADFHWLISFA